MNRIAAVVAGLSLAFIATSEATADTLNVPADYPTIIAAVNAASNGDEVHIDAGTYYESGIDPQGKAIVIRGKVTSGTLKTTIDGQSQGSIFTMNSGEGQDTEIRDLRLTNGGQEKWTFGGGIFCSEASPRIEGVEITNCTVLLDGGGLFLYKSNAIVSGCTITGNNARAKKGSSGGGGIYCFEGQPYILNNTICGNTSTQVFGCDFNPGDNHISDICPGLSGDLNNDGTVDIDDIRVLQQAAGICPSDINGDGETDIEDLLNVIEGWGNICSP